MLDGSLTAPLDVLLDGAVTACLGSWPQRIVDNCVEQRLTKHALLLEVSSLPQTHLIDQVAAGQSQLDATVLGLPAIAEATGGADLWWRDESTAIWCHLTSWPASDPEQWTITCFAETQAAADDLADAVGMLCPEALRTN